MSELKLKSIEQSLKTKRQFTRSTAFAEQGQVAHIA
jgi:hypothetical protein